MMFFFATSEKQHATRPFFLGGGGVSLGGVSLGPGFLQVQQLLLRVLPRNPLDGGCWEVELER